MSLTETLLWLVAGGGIGGLIGSLPTGLTLPRYNADSRTFDLGFVSTILFGAVAGLVSQVDKLKNAASASDLAIATIAALAVGIGGANWVKAHIEKTDIKNAAAILARKQPDDNAANRILQARSAREIVNIAESLR